MATGRSRAARLPPRRFEGRRACSYAEDNEGVIGSEATEYKADRGVARSDAPICDSAEWRDGEKIAKRSPSRNGAATSGLSPADPGSIDMDPAGLSPDLHQI